jgi:hypothetical protein
MARIIPNENSWIGFTPTVASPTAPTAANLTAAIDLTPYVISINASSRGNTVPTPAFDTLFETSIAGTVQATFDADFYRDDATGADLAWETLPRSTSGFFIISRFGGSGTNHKPMAGDTVEVWPVLIVSRTMANMSNNTVLTFTASASVPVEPVEDAIIAA